MATSKNASRTAVAAKGGKTEDKKPAGKGTALATKPKPEANRDQLPANINLASHAGAGLENTDRDSFAIPFIAIMQKGSPQVDKDDDKHVQGAEVGDLMLTSTSELFKDEDGVDIVFCGFERKFLRWAPVDNGGGFKGEVPIEQVVQDRGTGRITEEDNRLYYDNGDVVRDTRVHYVLVVRPDGSFVPAVLSMSSTQIKKSKMLLTQIQSFIAKDGDGKSFNPPSFGHIFHAETIAESNDKGSWRGWKFTRTDFVSDPELFQAAIDFHKLSSSGKAKVNFADIDAAGGERGNDDDNI